MSLIQEQIEALKGYKDLLDDFMEYKDGTLYLSKNSAATLSKLLNKAIFTIESQGEKLRASNQKDGWIPCSERMPEENEEVLISCEFGFRFIAVYAGKQEYNNQIVECFETDEGSLIICAVVKAWMPLPEPYKED